MPRVLQNQRAEVSDARQLAFAIGHAGDRMHLPSGGYVIPDAVTDQVPVGDDEAIRGKRFFQRYPMLAFDDTLGGSTRLAADRSCDEVNFHCRGPV